MVTPDTGHPDDTLDAYRGADGAMHARFRLGPQDNSPTVRRYGPIAGPDTWRRYHPRCSGCYMGNAHSVAYHDEHARGDW